MAAFSSSASEANMRSLAGRLDLCSMNTATIGFRESIACTIERVARAGFGAIAPWRREIDGEDVAAVARRIRDAGLAVSGYCRSTYIPAADAAAFRAGLDDNRRAIDQAAVLGAACFVMVVGGLPDGSHDLVDARGQLVEGTGLLHEHARAAGVRLALEPLHPMYAADRSVLSTLAQALDIADALEPDDDGDPWLGVALDVYHVWWDPALAEGIERAGLAQRLFAFHVCDWRRETRDMLNDRGMMGDGVIDIPAIRGMVEDAGYAGAVEVEVFSSLDWWQRPPEDVIAVAAERLQSVT
jgi:sugar phosphate isomerase/epimerase